MTYIEFNNTVLDLYEKATRKTRKFGEIFDEFCLLLEEKFNTGQQGFIAEIFWHDETCPLQIVDRMLNIATEHNIKTYATFEVGASKATIAVVLVE